MCRWRRRSCAAAAAAVAAAARLARGQPNGGETRVCSWHGASGATQLGSARLELTDKGAEARRWALRQHGCRLSGARLRAPPERCVGQRFERAQHTVMATTELNKYRALRCVASAQCDATRHEATRLDSTRLARPERNRCVAQRSRTHMCAGRAASRTGARADTERSCEWSSLAWSSSSSSV